jgi:hypothetical protein
MLAKWLPLFLGQFGEQDAESSNFLLVLEITHKWSQGKVFDADAYSVYSIFAEISC